LKLDPTKYFDYAEQIKRKSYMIDGVVTIGSPWDTAIGAKTADET
jgi:hypothetical protein